MPKKVKKKAKKPFRQNWCQMVIRVRVPKTDAKSMKAWMVYGVKSDRGPAHVLEILNAYYDIPGEPNALA